MDMQHSHLQRQIDIPPATGVGASYFARAVESNTLRSKFCDHLKPSRYLPACHVGDMWFRAQRVHWCVRVLLFCASCANDDITHDRHFCLGLVGWFVLVDFVQVLSSTAHDTSQEHRVPKPGRFRATLIVGVPDTAQGLKLLSEAHETCPVVVMIPGCDIEQQVVFR